MAQSPAARRSRDAGRLSRSIRSTAGVQAPKNAARVPPEPRVSFMRPELADQLSTYQLIRDCLIGQTAIKRRDFAVIDGKTIPPFGMAEYTGSDVYRITDFQSEMGYLPKPNPSDTSEDNRERYRQYIKRAVFYNVTRRTLENLIGLVFTRAPVITLPKELEQLGEDASGDGSSLIQFSKQAVTQTMGFGRVGILVDFPRTDGPITKAQKDSGQYRATLNLYSAWQVINWRYEKIGGVQTLVKVVIAERAILQDDGFKETWGQQFRVLELVNGVYQIRVWRQDKAPGEDVDTKDAQGAFQGEAVIPTGADGKPFTEIPFTFCGPFDNGPAVDHPPMADIAHLNIGHYRNSADYEESSFITGQPTPVLSGLTQEWVTDVLKGSIQLGARGSIPLPPDGKATLLQSEPNTMPFEAMKHKEEQMIGLGARLVEQSAKTKTATEARHDENTAKSVLASAAANVSQAILWALQRACEFEGAAFTDETLKFELNTEYDLIQMNAQLRQELRSDWESGMIAWDEMRHNLRRGGIATMDDTAAAAAIKADPPLMARIQEAGITARQNV